MILGRKLSTAALVLAVLILAARADQAPTTIEITAKRFAFVPDRITVTKGQTVTLKLHSEDVTHGLTIKELGIKTEIPKGRETVVTFVPKKAGTFEGKCSHFCGRDHGLMKLTVVVTE